MFRSLFTVAFAALAFAATAELREVPVDEDTRAAFVEACDYYGRRAESARAQRPDEFVVFLADTCDAAEALIESGTPEQRRRSALLLWRISELRRTVAGMNADRATAAAGTPTRWAGAYVPVSPSGEFLIAHRMGVMLAFRAWIDTGAPSSIARYP